MGNSAHDKETSSKCYRIQSNSACELKRGIMQQRLALPAKFYITKIGHNLGDLHSKTLKVPKLPQELNVADFLQDVGSGMFGNDVDYSIVFTRTTNIALLSGCLLFFYINLPIVVARQHCITSQRCVFKSSDYIISLSGRAYY